MKRKRRTAAVGLGPNEVPDWRRARASRLRWQMSLIAVIRSLQQLGEASATPVLERLAHEGNSRPASNRVPTAARETLPFECENAALAGSSREMLYINAQQTGPEL